MSLDIRKLYSCLFTAYGPQYWWPAETPFEILVGAVLVQNTRWQNVELALRQFDTASIRTPDDVLALDLFELERLLQPAGTFRVKARRLRALCGFVQDSGGISELTARPATELRRQLLAVHGIGPETADALLVYLFIKPAFVVDAYTRRLFERLGRADAHAPYERLRRNVELEFAGNAQEYNELHALIVEHGKRQCRKLPICEGCELRRVCRFGRRKTQGDL